MNPCKYLLIFLVCALRKDCFNRNAHARSLLVSSPWNNSSWGCGEADWIEEQLSDNDHSWRLPQLTQSCPE